MCLVSSSETSQSVAILLRRVVFWKSILSFSDIRFRSSVLWARLWTWQVVVKTLELTLPTVYTILRLFGRSYYTCGDLYSVSLQTATGLW